MLKRDYFERLFICSKADRVETGSLKVSGGRILNTRVLTVALEEERDTMPLGV